MNKSGIPELPYMLSRQILIHAGRDIVFGFFTDSGLWAQWWGQGSSIDPVVGGKVVIMYPNGIEAGGEVLEIEAPRLLRFSYGYASGKPMPSGSSIVTLELGEHVSGTWLSLTHVFADESVRDEHVQGWRYQLSVFANAAAAGIGALSQTRAAVWFEIWSESDSDRRDELIAMHCAAHVEFRDRYSMVSGRDDLRAHLIAMQRFMPGASLIPEGKARHCQGTVVADWVAHAADGSEMGRGSNVIRLGPDGLIKEVVGLWNDPS